MAEEEDRKGEFNFNWLWVAIGPPLAAGAVTWMMEPGPGPHGKRALELAKVEKEMLADPAYKGCRDVSPALLITQHRSPDFILDWEKGAFATEASLNAAVASLEAYLDRTRTYLETCRAAKAANAWDRAAISEATRIYMQKQDEADEAWRRDK